MVGPSAASRAPNRGAPDVAAALAARVPGRMAGARLDAADQQKKEDQAPRKRRRREENSE